MVKEVLQSCLVLLLISLLSGVIYPLIVFALGQLLWPHKSNGSLMYKNDIVTGSSLIAQGFVKPEYFWPRPSASNFNANPSGASNLGPTSGDLRLAIAQKREELAKMLHGEQQEIPIDLITTSASGLDPHISKAAAFIQAQRIAQARALGDDGLMRVRELIKKHIEKPQGSILGEERVNVLLLNLALDEHIR